MNNEFFKRNIKLWGKEKFDVLQKSTVIVFGAGGLGSNLLNILIRSGIGKIYVVDKGIVDKPDLNRQSLYYNEDIGKKKVELAAKRLNQIFNSKIVIPIFAEVNDNFKIPDDVQIVADCFDNFKSRFALDYVVPDGIPIVSGGVGFDYGQIISFTMGENSFKSIFANVDDSAMPKEIPVSADIVVAISSIMAKEIFNVLWNKPVLKNRFLVVEFSDFTFSKIDL